MRKRRHRTVELVLEEAGMQAEIERESAVNALAERDAIVEIIQQHRFEIRAGRARR